MARDPRASDAASAALEEAVGLAFRILQLAMVVLVGLFLLSGLFRVESHQTGFVRRFGVLDTAALEPGAHWGWPVIDEIVRVDRRSRRHVVGTFDLSQDDLSKLEGKQIERKGGLDPSKDGCLITGDANLIHVTLAARVNVRDPAHRSLVSATHPEEVVEVLLERAAVQAAAHRPVESLLGAGKTDYLGSVKRRLDDGLRDADLGLGVEQIDLERDLSPPPQVRDAFASVAKASQAVDELRSKAESEATELTSKGAVAAERRRSTARGEANRTTASARSDAARFQALLKEWREQPRTLEERLLTKTLVEVVDELGEVFLVPKGELRIRLERDVAELDQKLQDETRVPEPKEDE